MKGPIKQRPLDAWPKREPAKHDFGSFGMLTVMEASLLSGRHETTIYNRLKRGKLKGDALLAKYVGKPPKAMPRQSLNFSSGGVAESFYQGVLMHKLYGSKVPTRDMLMRDFGFTRATAYRKLQAYRAALGLP